MKIRILFAIISFLAFVNIVKAQSTGGDKISFGLESSRPNFTQRGGGTSSVGFGGSIKYDLFVASDFYVTASVQYLYFPYNDYGQAFAKSLEYYRELGAQDLKYSHSGDNFATLMIGSKYYFTKKIYGEAQVGLEIVAGALYGDSGAFVFSPGVGYNFSNSFDIGVRYQGWTESSILQDQLTLRVAYSLDAKKINQPKNDRRY